MKSSKKSKAQNPTNGYKRSELLSEDEIIQMFDTFDYWKQVLVCCEKYEYENGDENNPYEVTFETVPYKGEYLVTKKEYLREITRLKSLVDIEVENRTFPVLRWMELKGMFHTMM